MENGSICIDYLTRVTNDVQHIFAEFYFRGSREELYMMTTLQMALHLMLFALVVRQITPRHPTMGH